MSIKCELHSQSIQSHLLQIYAGFLMLRQSGRIEISQRIRRPAPGGPAAAHLRYSRNSHLRVVVNDHIQVHYDTHDSWEIDEEHLSDADFYFKRSFSSERVRALGAARKKIHPLGLNYAVYPDTFDRFGLQRALKLSSGARRVFEMVRALNILNGIKFTPRLRVMAAPPDYKAQPRILFMVRAFETNAHPDLTPEKIEERHQINEDRAECIKVLRGEFGDRFFGGFVHTDFAVKNYRTYLARDKSVCSKDGYIKLLGSYPICIATTGIHGSIGWKFAEYVAFSKAIVSERLNYEVPGDLARDRNYVEFVTTSECVEQVRRLVDDRALRESLMANNARYYEEYLQPDVLVWNTLEAAIEESSVAR